MTDENNNLPENNGAAKPRGFISKKNLIFLILVAVLTFAIGGAILVAGVSNTPENRLSRHMRAAERYLAEMDYERAVIEYQRVLEIDPMNVEAILGLTDAYIGLNNINMAIETLETCLERTHGNIEIEQRLIELYFVVMKGDLKYEEKLAIYDKLLSLTTEDKKVIYGLCECLKEYIAFLMDKEMYDEIKVLAEKYRSIAFLINFESIMESVHYRILVREILTNIAAFCSVDDYENVLKLLHSKKYEPFLEKINRITDIYCLDTGYGKIGIYKVDSEHYGNYMIYYGGFKDDKRHGLGVWLGYNDNNYYLARGTWKSDLPQGEFKVREWNSMLAEDVIYRVTSGNVDDGLWNGNVLIKFECESGITNAFQVSFKNGKWIILKEDSDDKQREYIVSEKDTGLVLIIYDEDLDKSNGIVGFTTDDH